MYLAEMAELSEVVSGLETTRRRRRLIKTRERKMSKGRWTSRALACVDALYGRCTCRDTHQL